MVLVPREDSLDEPLHWDDLSSFRERALLEDSDDSLHDHPRTRTDDSSDADYVSGETPAAIYLRDISRVKLLTAEQEVEYAKAIEQGRFSEEALNDGQLDGPDHIEELRNLIREGLEAKRKLTEA